MIPNDPLYKDQWHLHILEMEKVWDIEPGKPNVIIAVIEPGFDVNHPDLKNQIYKTINTCGSDDNMISIPHQNADARTDHGTHMLGLIAAEINNKEGGVGVSPGCRLLPIKTHNANDDEELALAIQIAVDEGAKVINMSWAGYCYLGKIGKPIVPRQWSPPRSDKLYQACQYAVKNNVLMCRAAGGNQAFFEMNWPAAYHPGLNVIQGNPEGTGPANFCAVNEYADVMSPGGSRVKSGNPDWPWSEDSANLKSTALLSTISVKNGSYKHWSGGCMSTAVASGVAGLLFSRFPKLTVDQARQVICNTAKGSGWDRYKGHRYINPLGIMKLDKIECALELSEPTIIKEGGNINVEVVIKNKGILDAKDTLLVLYSEKVDTPETRQIAHKPVSLARGLESTKVVMKNVKFLPDTKELWALLDARWQLSEEQRERGVYYLTSMKKV